MKKQTARWPAWLTHRGLLMTETVLVVALLQMLLKDWVFSQSQIPGSVRVLLGMGLIVGAFGWLLGFLQKRVQWGLHTTHKAADRLPIPARRLALHVAVLVGLFVAYAWYWHLPMELPSLPFPDFVDG